MDLKDFVNDAVVEESAVEWLAPRGWRTTGAEGESSGSGSAGPEVAVAMSRGDCIDRDLHHKRAKVQLASV